MVKKFWWFFFVLAWSTNVTDTQTDRRKDGQTPHDDIGRACIASRGNKTIYWICQSYVQSTVSPFFPDMVFLWKEHFSMTWELRHHYVMSCKYIDETFYNFSVTRNVRMICAKIVKSCLNLFKVTAQILSVPFFRTRCVYYVLTMSRCPDVCLVPTSAFLSLRMNSERIWMKFTTTNTWTDCILGELVSGNSNRRQSGAAP